MAKRNRVMERAHRSGFWKKLRRWLEINGDEGRAPSGVNDLARRITTDGEEVGASAVSAWKTGKSLPGAEYVGIIERLMGAPWAYIDDAKTPWPPGDDDAILFSLVLDRSDRERAAIRSVVTDALRRRRGPS